MKGKTKSRKSKSVISESEEDTPEDSGSEWDTDKEEPVSRKKKVSQKVAPERWGTTLAGAKVGSFAAVEATYGARKGISIEEVFFCCCFFVFELPDVSLSCFQIVKIDEDWSVWCIDWWSMTCKTIDPNCIKYIFDSCHLYLHLSRGVWVRPTKERADREHPAPKASIVNLASVITWFDIERPLKI